MINNKLSMTIMSNREMYPVVFTGIESMLQSCEINKETLDNIKTAVSEILTNCTDHAYPDKPGVVHVYMSLIDNNTFTISIRDHGCGIADIQKAMTPLYTTGDPEKHSGMGFSVMECFVDKVKVRSVEKQGTTVKLIAKLNND